MRALVRTYECDVVCLGSYVYLGCGGCVYVVHVKIR